MLPNDFPPYQAVYYWFRRLRRRMLFRTIHDLGLMLDRLCSAREVVPTAGVVDSQSVKAPAAHERGYDANKKVCGRKRHVAVDTHDRLLAVNLTAENIPALPTSTQCGVSGWCKNGVLYPLDNDGLGFGFRAFRKPVGVRSKCIPLFFPVGQAVPLEHIRQCLVAWADQCGPESDGFNAVLFPKFQGDGFKPLIQRRQAARRTVIDA
jgi:hypothetical protein